MPNLAIGFGAVLLVLGIVSYLGTGSVSLTALIPSAFGLVLVLLGVAARNPARRKLAMHIAVIVSLVGFFGAAPGIPKFLQMISGESVARPTAVIAQVIMAILCLVFTGLCVRSFIDARRNRTLEGTR